MTDPEITYVHAPEHHRYEIRDGAELAGFTQYRLPDDEHVDFVHTEVDDKYAGQGLAWVAWQEIERDESIEVYVGAFTPAALMQEEGQ